MNKEVSRQTDPLRILLVEDNEAFRGVLTKQLESLGCEVHTTPDASKFLSRLSMAETTFQLLIVDIRLPDLKGDQIISWLRASEDWHIRTLPILIVTGYASELPEEVLAAPFLTILEKPFSYSDLRAEVHKISAPQRLH